MKLPRNFIDINMALSREHNQPKRYVQDLLGERATDVLSLLQDENTSIFVCGLKGMEEGVINAFRDMAQKAGLAWPDLHTQLRQQGRLHFETY